MKKIQKIFFAGLIFLAVLFLQMFFSEKNFAESIKKKPEFNQEKCQNDILKQMKKIASENRKAYFKITKKICSDDNETCLTLSDKWEMIAENFRILSCNFDVICQWLTNSILYWGSDIWQKNIKFITNSCPQLKMDFSFLKSCYTDDTNSFKAVLKFCEENKKRILYWEKWDWWENQWVQHNFSIDAKKDKINFLAARIYALNKKVREILIANMFELKIKLNWILDKMVCTEKK